MSVAEHTCRTCGKMSEQEDGSDLYPMYTSTEYCNELKMILEEFEIWNLNIGQGDGLPQKICLTCFDSFCQIHNFRVICQEAQMNFGELCIGLDIIIKLEAEYGDVNVDYPEDFEGEQTITVQEHYQFPAGEPRNVTDITGSRTCEKLLETINSDEECMIEDRQDAIENTNTNASELKQYQCEYCMDIVTFNDPELLNQHYNVLHSSDLPYQCPNCEKCFDAKSKRNTHAKAHFRITIDCDICGRKIRGGKRMMAQHKELHHVLKLRECTTCGKKFDNITLKRFHYHQSWHDESKLHKCKYCEKKFIQVTHLVVHERTHTGESPYLCNECGLGFKTSGLLQAHTKMHGIQELQCPCCPKAFFHQQSLTNHLQIHDSNREISRCDICEKPFLSSINLRLHNHIRHGAPATPSDLNILKKREKKNALLKPFRCNKIDQNCTESFALHSQLEKHMRTHSEVRPYTCDHCGKAFKRISHLNLHVNSLHLYKKPHKCSICGWAFPQKSNLKEHMATKHDDKKDFKCDICGKEFALSKTLRTHRRSHLESKLLSCTVCNRSFRKLSILKLHINSHQGKRETSPAAL